MKFLLSLIFVFNIGGSAIFAQSPPPPAPLIYKAPEKSILEEFIPEDKSFQITFPGVPKITKQEIANGKATNYRVYRQGSNSILNTIDYDFALNDAAKIYEVVKANLLKIPKSTIEAEKDIKIDGISGKEFDVLQDYQFQKIRILIVGKRIYEIRNDVTNWHILSEYDKDKVAEFENETTRFFNSFKSLKSPESVIVPVPSDFLGTATDSDYKNTFFDFSFSFLKEWRRLDKSEINASKSVGLEILKTEKEKTNKAFEDATKKEVVMFVVTPKSEKLEKGASFGVGVLKQPSNQISSEMVAVATKNFFLTNPNFKLIKDVQKTEVNGTAFSTFSLQSKDFIQQKLFITIRKGYSVTFVLTYLNSEGQSSLEKIMESLKFDTK
ncbi:MAG: hypothetical protein LH614_06775 [Pyrinomonadaceae bacterium]|nr:hypothetical protein [Pyrinomonadaceae bacterium]